MPHIFSQTSHAKAVLAALTLCSGLTAAPGCFSEDTVTPALKAAATRLEALGAPGTGVPGDEFRISEYTAAVTTLRPIAAAGTDAQNAAAALMIARAQVGLAEPAATSINTANQDLHALVSELRSAGSEWATLNSLAETAASFDPSQEQSQINERIQQRDATVAAARKASETVKAQVAELEQLARQASQNASDLRVQEEQLRGDAAKLSAQEALPLHKQAAKVRREADAYEVISERHLAKAATIRPEIQDHELEINRLTQQRDLLVASSQEVAAKAVQGRNEAAKLREQAAETAQRLDRLVSKINAFRRGEIKTALDAVTEAYSTAAASAGSARAGDRSGSQLAVGEIQQTLGNLLSVHASTLEFAALALSQIAETRTPLPNADTVAAAATSMRADANMAKANALAAFTAARDGFDGASLSGEASDRINAVKSDLENAIRSLTTDPQSPEGTPEDVSESGPADDANDD